MSKKLEDLKKNIEKENILSDEDLFKRTKELLDDKLNEDKSKELEIENKALKELINQQNEKLEEYRKLNQQLYLKVSQPIKIETEEELTEEEKELEEINKKIEQINKGE